MTRIESRPDLDGDNAGGDSGLAVCDPPSTFERAVQFAERGFYVFPCKPGAKTPATRDGFKSATNDPERVRQMFGARSDFNIGLVPGLSGHVVVDVDTEEGAEALRELWGGEIPETVSWRTGRGVQHLYRSPVELRSRTGVVPGVDVRANDGYAILPPSIHPSGKRYTFLDGTGKVATLTHEQAAALGASRSTETPPQEDLRAPSVERLADVVSKIPNEGPRFASRSAYLQVGYAIKAAGGEEAYDLFATWAARWADGANEPETVRRDWDGMHVPFRVGFPYLLELAGINLAVEAFEADPAAVTPEPPESERPNRVARFATPYEDITYRPPRFLTRGRTLDSDINFSAGDGGSWKSTDAVFEACAVASGTSLPGYELVGETPRPVLIVSEEDDESQFLNKIAAVVSSYSLTIPPGFLRIMAQRGFSFGSEEWCNDLIAYVRSEGFALVIFDPLAEMEEGKENSNDDARPGINVLRQITRRGGPAVRVIHHSGKTGGEGKSKIDRFMRGASARKNAARSILAFTRTADGFEVESLKMSRTSLPDPTVFRVTVTTDPEDKHGIRWERVRIVALPKWQAERTGAEDAITEALRESPGLTSTELREIVRAEGHRVEAISKAIASMESRDRIAFDPGPHGSKLWRLVDITAEGFDLSDLTEDGPSGRA